MSEHVGIIGSPEVILPFRVLGFKVFPAENMAEARRALGSLESMDIALCFVQEALYRELEEDVEALAKKFTPVIVGFSDFREVTQYLEERIRTMAVKATGSDSLIKRKEKDEAR